MPAAPHPDPATAKYAAARWGAGFFFAGLALLGAAVLLPFRTPGDWGDGLIRNTIRLSFAWYVVSLWGMIRLDPQDWAARSPAGRRVRWAWTWAAVCYVAHVAAAFHFAYHWSHRVAYERTRLASGFGPGIYISYLFTALWAADAAWWWVGPASRTARPAWVGRALHAFMVVIVFNGTVIFVAGGTRMVGIAAFTGLAAYWLVLRRRARQPVEAH